MKAVIDSLKRPLKDRRISITDRCNLRCQYCMPEELFGPGFAFSPREEILTYEEINRAVEAFLQLGIRKIRITGGEPLLRRDIGDRSGSWQDGARSGLGDHDQRAGTRGTP